MTTYDQDQAEVDALQTPIYQTSDEHGIDATSDLNNNIGGLRSAVNTLSHQVGQFAKSSIVMAKDVARAASQDFNVDKTGFAMRTSAIMGGPFGAMLTKAIHDSGVADRIGDYVKDGVGNGVRFVGRSVKSMFSRSGGKNYDNQSGFMDPSVLTSSMQQGNVGIVNELNTGVSKQLVLANKYAADEIKETQVGNQQIVTAIKDLDASMQGKQNGRTGSKPQSASQVVRATAPIINNYYQTTNTASSGSHGGTVHVDNSEVVAAINALNQNYTDNTNKEGKFSFFTSIFNGTRLGTLFKGKYTADIAKSRNPLETQVSALLQIYRWQRLYGELQKKQLNELIQLSGGEEKDVVGEHGVLHEAWWKQNDKMKKAMGPLGNFIGDMLFFDNERLDTMSRTQASGALQNVIEKPSERTGFKGLGDNFKTWWKESGSSMMGTQGYTYNQIMEQENRLSNRYNNFEGVKEFHDDTHEFTELKKAKDERDVIARKLEKAKSKKKINPKKIEKLEQQLKAIDDKHDFKKLNKLSSRYTKKYETSDKKKTNNSSFNLDKYVSNIKGVKKGSVPVTIVKSLISAEDGNGKKIIPMAEGGIVNKPITGTASDGTPVKIGESGSEAVIPLDNKKSVIGLIASDVAAIRKSSGQSNENIAELAKAEIDENKIKKAADDKSKRASIWEKAKKGKETGGSLMKSVKGIGGFLLKNPWLLGVAGFALIPGAGKWLMSSVSNFAKGMTMIKKVGPTLSLIPKFFSGFSKIFGTLGKAFTGFNKMGHVGKILKIGAKLGGKAAMKTTFKIPVVGSLLQVMFAINRFRKGEIRGGLLEIASGIASLFPGIGTGISLLIDAVNMFADISDSKIEKDKDGKPKGKTFGQRAMRAIPGIGTILRVWDGIQLWRQGEKGKAIGEFLKGIVSITAVGAPIVTAIEWIYDIFKKSGKDDKKEDTEKTQTPKSISETSKKEFENKFANGGMEGFSSRPVKEGNVLWGEAGREAKIKLNNGTSAYIPINSQHTTMMNGLQKYIAEGIANGGTVPGKKSYKDGVTYSTDSDSESMKRKLANDLLAGVRQKRMADGGIATFLNNLYDRNGSVGTLEATLLAAHFRDLSPEKRAELDEILSTGGISTVDKLLAKYPDEGFLINKYFKSLTRKERSEIQEIIADRYLKASLEKKAGISSLIGRLPYEDSANIQEIIQKSNEPNAISGFFTNVLIKGDGLRTKQAEKDAYINHLKKRVGADKIREVFESGNSIRDIIRKWPMPQDELPPGSDGILNGDTVYAIYKAAYEMAYPGKKINRFMESYDRKTIEDFDAEEKPKAFANIIEQAKGAISGLGTTLVAPITGVQRANFTHHRAALSSIPVTRDEYYHDSETVAEMITAAPGRAISNGIGWIGKGVKKLFADGGIDNGENSITGAFTNLLANGDGINTDRAQKKFLIDHVTRIGLDKYAAMKSDSQNGGYAGIRKFLEKYPVKEKDLPSGMSDYLNGDTNEAVDHALYTMIEGKGFSGISRLLDRRHTSQIKADYVPEFAEGGIQKDNKKVNIAKKKTPKYYAEDGKKQIKKGAGQLKSISLYDMSGMPMVGGVLGGVGKGAVETVTNVAAGAGHVLGGGISAAGNVIGGAAKGIGQAGWGALKGAGHATWGVMSGVGHAAAGIGKGVWSGVSGVGSGLLSFFQGKGDEGIKQIVKGLGGVVTNIFSGIGKGTWSILKGFGKGVWSLTKGIASGAWSIVKGVGKGFVSAGKGVIKGAWSLTKSVVALPKNIIVGFTKGAATTVKALATAPVKIATGIGNVVAGTWKWMTGENKKPTAKNAVEMVKNSLGNKGGKKSESDLTGGSNTYADIFKNTIKLAKENKSPKDLRNYLSLAFSKHPTLKKDKTARDYVARKALQYFRKNNGKISVTENNKLYHDLYNGIFTITEDPTKKKTSNGKLIDLSKKSKSNIDDYRLGWRNQKKKDDSKWSTNLLKIAAHTGLIDHNAKRLIKYGKGKVAPYVAKAAKWLSNTSAAKYARVYKGGVKNLGFKKATRAAVKGLTKRGLNAAKNGLNILKTKATPVVTKYAKDIKHVASITKNAFKKASGFKNGIKAGASAFKNAVRHSATGRRFVDGFRFVKSQAGKAFGSPQLKALVRSGKEAIGAGKAAYNVYKSGKGVKAALSMAGKSLKNSKVIGGTIESASKVINKGKAALSSAKNAVVGRVKNVMSGGLTMSNIVKKGKTAVKSAKAGLTAAKTALTGGFKSLMSGGLKTGLKTVAKGGFKQLAKKIPVIGTIMSLFFAFQRFKKGEWGRGVIELLSGIAALVPGVGTGISIVLDILNMFLDKKMSDKANSVGTITAKKPKKEKKSDKKSPSWLKKFFPMFAKAKEHWAKGNYLRAIGYGTLGLALAGFAPITGITSWFLKKIGVLKDGDTKETDNKKPKSAREASREAREKFEARFTGGNNKKYATKEEARADRNRLEAQFTGAPTSYDNMATVKGNLAKATDLKVSNDVSKQRKAVQDLTKTMESNTNKLVSNNNNVMTKMTKNVTSVINNNSSNGDISDPFRVFTKSTNEITMI